MESPRLLSREVRTRWGSFDQLLILTVKYRVVLDKFMMIEDYGFPKWFWHFCALISKYTTKPLREITAVAIKDSGSIRWDDHLPLIFRDSKVRARSP